MYKTDIEFLREKYREKCAELEKTLEELNRTRREIEDLKRRAREIINEPRTDGFDFDG